MSQQIKIQLNTDAVNALFPEGSEARLDLQNAVIANFVKRNADTFANLELSQYEADIMRYVQTQIDEYQKRATDLNCNARLTETFKSKIRDQVREQLATEQVDTIISELNAEYEKQIERITNHGSTLNERLSRQWGIIEGRMNSILSGAESKVNALKTLLN